MSNLSNFIKYQRKKIGLTQEDVALKSGVGLRFIRDLEQGKATLQLDKVEQVLQLFGFQLDPRKKELDPYYIYWNCFNKPVKITLTNRLIKYGIILKEITDKHENRITAWKFVSNPNAINYQQKPNDDLTELIRHSDILEIEEQAKN